MRHMTCTTAQVPATIKALNERKIPIFGVCLGLQGMIEVDNEREKVRVREREKERERERERENKRERER